MADSHFFEFSKEWHDDGVALRLAEEKRVDVSAAERLLYSD